MATFQTYNVETVLGKGGMGKVYLVKTMDGYRRALKQISLTLVLNNPKALKNAHNEVKLMEKFSKHRNIVQIFSSFEDCGFVVQNDGTVTIDRTDHCLYIEMEYCGGKSLYSKIIRMQNEKKRFEEDKIMSWFVDISCAVKFLHKNGTIHRDIKSQNILFMADNSTVKLGDFGVAKLMDGVDNANPAGTVTHMPPEVLEAKVQGKRETYKPDFKEDVWALGVVLYEMAALELPFRGKDVTEISQKVMLGQRPALPVGLYSVELTRLIDQMLVVEQLYRPTLEKITSDSYFKTARKLNLEKQIGQERKQLQNENASLRQEIERLKATLKVQTQKEDGEVTKLRSEVTMLIQENKRLREELALEIQRCNYIKKDLQRELEAKVAAATAAAGFKYNTVVRIEPGGPNMNLSVPCLKLRMTEVKGKRAFLNKQQTVLQSLLRASQGDDATFTSSQTPRTPKKHSRQSTTFPAISMTQLDTDNRLDERAGEDLGEESFRITDDVTNKSQP